MRVFVGGATGATGRQFVPQAQLAGLEQVVHVRPRSAAKYREVLGQSAPEPALFDLEDSAALDEAMAGCRGVVTMIGTMRERFSSGDTYAASDIGANQRLVEAALRAGVKHFVLMGALGTSWIPGSYYDAKREAERLVMNSGMTWTILRPSALWRDERDGELSDLTDTLDAVAPELADRVKNIRPIPVLVCARAMVRVVRDGLHRNAVMKGRDIWPLGGPLDEG